MKGQRDVVAAQAEKAANLVGEFIELEEGKDIIGRCVDRSNAMAGKGVKFAPSPGSFHPPGTNPRPFRSPGTDRPAPFRPPGTSQVPWRNEPGLGAREPPFLDNR